MPPAHVYGFTLRMSPEAEQSLRELLGEFIQRPKNVRKYVTLHMTLLVNSFREGKVEELLDFLSTWKPQLPKVGARLGRLEKYGQTYIGFPVEGAYLQPIHEYLTDCVQPYTCGQYDPKYLAMKLTEKQREYLETYGYHRVKEFFEPHITIGKYETEAVRDSEYIYAPAVEGNVLFDHLVLDKALSGALLPAEVLWKLPLVD